jgi:aminoglycoside phosphotransferase (APT) family kinase protein
VDDLTPFAAVAGKVEPGARLLLTETFPGGLSASMTVLDLEAPGGRRRRLVVRSARDPDAERRSLSIGDEFRLLLSLEARGLRVPTPRLFDDSGTIFDHPYSVFDYVEGSPRVSSSDPAATGRSFADELASVHDVDLSTIDVAGLPRRTEEIGRQLEAPPGEGNEAEVNEDGGAHGGGDGGDGFLRELLRTRWPPPEPDRRVLLHGDFWAGNLLWRDDEIVAVIDWEEAATGDPLTDVATTRLDLLWAFGPEAMTAFTDHYFSLTSVDPTSVDPTSVDPGALALWDLVAAIRPAGVFSAWVADWADFGRPDMNATDMRARLRWFADQALGALGLSR